MNRKKKAEWHHEQHNMKNLISSSIKYNCHRTNDWISSEGGVAGWIEGCWTTKSGVGGRAELVDDL